MTAAYAGTLALVLASPQSPNDPGGQGPDFGKSSPVGLLVLILFFVAIAFLARSMTKHLRRVPVSFDQPTGDAQNGDAQNNVAKDNVAKDKGTRDDMAKNGAAKNGVAKNDVATDKQEPTPGGN